MATLAVCALLLAGAGLFCIALLRIAWAGSLMAWRGVLRLAEAVLQRISADNQHGTQVR